jgi:hypothetical protein
MGSTVFLNSASKYNNLDLLKIIYCDRRRALLPNDQAFRSGGISMAEITPKPKMKKKSKSERSHIRRMKAEERRNAAIPK